MTQPPYRIVVGAGTFSDCEVESEAADGRGRFEIAAIDSTNDVATATAHADAIVVTVHRMSAEYIDALGSSVRIIARCGIGLDAIDLDHALARGIAVYHEPGYATEEVATHAIALILATNRRLVIADHVARSNWPDWPSIGQVRALSGLTLGLVGYGRIGQAVARGMRPLVKDLLVYDPVPPEDSRPHPRLMGLDDVLANSDIVSLHAPLTDETAGMIGKRELSLMRPGSVLINVSRGRLVDEAALCSALESGHLGMAGLDVLSDEPPAVAAPILKAPNTILSPHFAWYSDESARRVRARTAVAIVEFLQGHTPTHGRLAVVPHGWPSDRSV